jgi:hypothetical protein
LIIPDFRKSRSRRWKVCAYGNRPGPNLNVGVLEEPRHNDVLRRQNVCAQGCSNGTSEWHKKIGERHPCDDNHDNTTTTQSDWAVAPVMY